MATAHTKTRTRNARARRQRLHVAFGTRQEVALLRRRNRAGLCCLDGDAREMALLGRNSGNFEHAPRRVAWSQSRGVRYSQDFEHGLESSLIAASVHGSGAAAHHRGARNYGHVEHGPIVAALDIS